ncbi:MAG: DUF5916 domain-containing protein [Gemmatimonadales bacterium]
MMPSAIRLGGCAHVLVGALMLWPAPLLAQGPDGEALAGARAITIPRVDRPPKLEDFLRGESSRPTGLDHHTLLVLNGPLTVLDGSPRGDTFGGAVRVTEFRQRKPADGVPVSQPTTAYLSYDAANLYVVFVCQDDPAKVRANIARRESIGGDDEVLLYLDTFHDHKRAYLFAANPLGIQLDGILTEGQEFDISFDAVWSSEGRLTDDGYIVRMAIPFRSLRFANDSVQTWGIALGRKIRRTNEETYWPHLTKRVTGFVPQLGSLNGLAQISPGRNVQLNPYTMFARARVLDKAIATHVTQGDERVGVDAKVVVRDALTLDATVNPDFSQVESDDPQVTVNQRFEVFFPEKRPFFLENTGFFQTPVADLLFSRRIVDPAAGLRLTGKAGRWVVGALAINDRAPLGPGEPPVGQDAWVGAVRVQRELGKESTVGLLATDREFLRSWRQDRMFSADARWRVGKNWALVGQLMHSQNREDEGTRSSGWGMLAHASRNGRHFDYSGRYREFSPDFSAPLGFVGRVGFRDTKHEWAYTFLPKGTVVSYGPSLAVLFNWDHSIGRLQDREIEAQFTAELRGNTELKISRVAVFELFEGLEFRPSTTQAKFQTEWLKWLGLDVSYAWGTAVNHDPAGDLAPSLGDARVAEVGLTLRPTPQLRLEPAYVHSSLTTRPGATRIFTERKLRGKLNYLFNPLWSLRAIVDWKAQDTDTTLFDDERKREWAVDLLLTYQVHPGTALYLGYTDRYKYLTIVGTPAEVVPSRSPGVSVGRQVFVKLSYLWRL